MEKKIEINIRYSNKPSFAFITENKDLYTINLLISNKEKTNLFTGHNLLYLLYKSSKKISSNHKKQLNNFINYIKNYKFNIYTTR